jgi:fatty acid synthase subunit alpha, fungi type
MPVFSMLFLVVGVPFHSQYVRDAVDKVIYQDLDCEELWIAEELQIPMHHTENGGQSNLL